jgi:hypothetical protein
MAKTKNNELEWYWWVIIILIAIIAILLFVGTFGTVDITSDKEKPARPKPTKQEIFAKHEELLKTLIQKREQIFRTRKRIYNIVYFSIRLLLIGFWTGGNLMLYYVFDINNIGTIIDYNNAFIILMVALVFLFWGKLSTLKDWVILFEKRLELWIFQKYIRLPELIENNKTALAEIKESQVKIFS